MSRFIFNIELYCCKVIKNSGFNLNAIKTYEISAFKPLKR